MPAPRLKRHAAASVLLATIVLGINPSGQAADKAPWVGETLDGKKCMGKSMGFGPYDYLRRASLQAELEVVENAHFTPEVERLEAGNTATAINDIAYTITAWPNHHRALYSAMRYRMAVWEWPEKAQVPPAECQLQRAIAFSPNDPVPHMMYGMLLHKAKKYDQALVSYRAANRLRPDDVLTLYNMGLTLVELKQYNEAVQAAKSAYAAGIPLPGLKNKLIAAGQWPGTAKNAEASAAAAPTVETQQPPKTPTKKAADNDQTKGTSVDTTNAAPKDTTIDTPTDTTKELPEDTAQSATSDKQRVDAPVVTE